MARYTLSVSVLFLSLIICFPAVGSHSSPVFNSWFALGSGCRARSDLPGNVQMLEIKPLHGDSSIHRVKFLFKDFKLDERVFTLGMKRFGRECAIRLNINPPPGKKIVGLSANTTISVAKDRGYDLDVLSEFKLGAVSLGLNHRTFKQSESFVERAFDISLSAGKGQIKTLPHLGCGEPKIIGFDYSWIVSRRQGEGPTAPVTLSRDKSLILEAVLRDCGV